MNTATISIKTTPKTKAEAQAFAEERGLSLNKLLENYLKKLTHKKKLLDKNGEELNETTIKSLEQSEKDLKVGKGKSFNNSKEALDYLHSITVHDKTTQL